ncbi:MAG: hypothetical protein AB1705_09220 [Verrucomicrobiota bacterium]
MKDNLLVLTGAVLGGALGYGAFFWLVSQGFYGLILPGGLIGIGAGMFKTKSLAIPIACGMLALALGLLAEWRFAPFAKDDGLGYFLSHVHDLRPITLLMIALGAGLGFYVPFRRTQDARKAG